MLGQQFATLIACYAHVASGKSQFALEHDTIDSHINTFSNHIVSVSDNTSNLFSNQIKNNNNSASNPRYNGKNDAEPIIDDVEGVEMDGILIKSISLDSAQTTQVLISAALKFN
ncbi:hypothetical protein BGX29_001553 [Mortierella sp. GBA35]|nr:hypothetical protein BGX29_001553 [Mortierella sp. GBA35]